MNKGTVAQNMIRCGSVVFFVLFAAELAAEVTEVADAGRVFVSGGESFKSRTVSVTEYPLQEEPMFWLDATATNSWEFNAQGEILKIPSKSASSRYLTSEGSDIIAENYSNKLWYDSVKGSKIRKPTLDPVDDGLNGSCIDFGERGSRKVLFFNPVTAGENAAPSNTLSGIGTIIGVYRSVDGGGNILGGESFCRWSTYWSRGTNLWDAVVNQGYRDGNDNSHILNGVFWTGLQKSSPKSSFWSGDWQVIVLKATSATAVAHGLCGNCENHDAFESTGGQKIAELMLFDSLLDDSDITNLVVYLERKWMGRTPRGYNGNARISWLEIGGTAEHYPQNGVDVSVDVDAGDTLTVDRLTGGRSTESRKHRLIKTGTGTLRLNEGSTFGGIVTVQEGTLSLGGRRTPTAAELPAAARIHFDPSVSSTVERDAGGCVSRLRSLGASVDMVQGNEKLRPGLITDAPRQGLNLLDFNEFNADSGRVLKLESNSEQIGTLVMVVDSSTYTGAHVMNGMFSSRTSDSRRFETSDLWNGINALFFTYKEVLSGMSPQIYGNAWVNGRKVSHETEAYDVPGLNVVAMRVPAHHIHYLGGYSDGICGGLRIGEVMGWNAELSEDEILDVSAYLMNKWLGRAAPGYAPSDASEVADVQEVVAEEGISICVPAGERATIGRLTASGTVFKVGGGTLKLESVSGDVSRLVVSEGEVVRSGGADVSSACEIAKEPTVHFDPSKSWTLRTKNYNGTNFVWTVIDEKGLVSAYDNMESWSLFRHPFVSGESEDFCNGLQTVNFGRMICGYNSKDGAYLKLSRNIHNARSVYFVLGSHEGGGNPLGSSMSTLTLGNAVVGQTRLDFYRGSTSDDTLKTQPLFNASSEAVKNGVLYVNGIPRANGKDYVPNGGYELVELHLRSGAQFNAIGNGYDYYVHGGFRMGEMLVYERELTERERVATRNYLLKKWFAKTDAELAALPEVPEKASIGYSLKTLVVDFASAQGVDRSDAVVGFAEGVKVEVKNIGNIAIGGSVPVLTAADFVDTQNLKTAVFVGDAFPKDTKIRFYKTGGTLYAKYAQVGRMQIIFR